MYIRNCLENGVFAHISKDTVFHEDRRIYQLIRSNITTMVEKSVHNMDLMGDKQVILDIGPDQVNPCFDLNQTKHKIETVDIIDNPITTYVADLTKPNQLPKDYYDVVYCLEVIEHCDHPENLLKQIYQLIKPNGLLYLSTPFQFRLHGPLPDYWRISEYGLKCLANKTNFKILELEALVESNRPAFPLHYTMICQK